LVPQQRPTFRGGANLLSPVRNLRGQPVLGLQLLSVHGRRRRPTPVGGAWDSVRRPPPLQHICVADVHAWRWGPARGSAAYHRNAMPDVPFGQDVHPHRPRPRPVDPGARPLFPTRAARGPESRWRPGAPHGSSGPRHRAVISPKKICGWPTARGEVGGARSSPIPGTQPSSPRSRGAPGPPSKGSPGCCPRRDPSCPMARGCGCRCDEPRSPPEPRRRAKSAPRRATHERVRAHAGCCDRVLAQIRPVVGGAGRCLVLRFVF